MNSFKALLSIGVVAGTLLLSGFANGTADLSSPLTTIELLRQNAVVGIRGIFGAVIGLAPDLAPSTTLLGIDDFQAQRAPDGRYRTAPLKGLWTHQKGGFYHDGRFANLSNVVDHYDVVFGLLLTVNDKLALVEYLKSL